ncbi:MAG: MBL fold metallo-hydrolase [Acidimicrobiales bacterium]
MQRWTIGDWTITRVADPGFELTLPQDEATKATLERSPWLHPAFVTDGWDLRVGSSALLIRGEGPTVLVDPWLAFDGDHGARLAALSDAGAGAGPDDVDLVINTHVDGIGANVAPDGRTPAFVNARYLLPAEERAEAARLPGWQALEDHGVVSDAAPGAVAPGLEIVDLPGHSPGHVGVRVGDGAVIIGHLFLHPAQVANPSSPFGDFRPEVLIRTRTGLLEQSAADGTVVIGPLWAAPGGGRITREGERWGLLI